MRTHKGIRFILRNTSILLFVLLFVIFGILSPRFFTAKNFENILTSASYIGIIAVGMTFVLLTGGIDLSVGANMYVSGAVLAVLLNTYNLPVSLAFIGCLAVGFAFGCFNAFAITKLQIVPFVVTMGTLTAGRGIGLLITHSYSQDYPPTITSFSVYKLFNLIPLPIVTFAIVVFIAWLFLGHTKTGRQIYAVGNDIEAAKKAGINTLPLIASTYIISGMCAALGGFVSISQLNRMNPNFGSGDEFDAIAAAVLGGASLFGGIGTVFPGTVLGTVMIQMIQAGLVFTQVDLYIQPLVMAAIIFLAVFIDSFRNIQLKKLERRHIMKQE
ncbi:MAG: ABC transporter permease [Candidatus Vecturithrix sp.]|nr:ABC transporter permease [Candidatus Vecturithrix sp.]